MTEGVDPRYRDLDTWNASQTATAIWESQLAAVAAVGPALPDITLAVEAAAGRLSGGTGRIVYAGAGTSARVAVQDGSELGPTFDWPSERIAFLIAGGPSALLEPSEGAEDDRDDGARQAMQATLGPGDVLIAVAASGRTPFTLAVAQAARRQGTLTIGVCNSPGAPLTSACEFGITVDTGPELLAGSTRMKAGTAQKVVLNMISTQVMIRMGRVYESYMVEMRPLNDKLRQRAVEMVCQLARCTPGSASDALERTGWSIKAAVLVAGGLEADEATRRLTSASGNLRLALESSEDHGQ
ncbi:N-acetylmuramic acid 6-phosphate etherase [Rubellimicrobium rubrum]|uniref:N-acetylmuramic acid 6-phosphate etherase n=1 Tax=Rubellimicrobium rubrum TaxID=2585369 RepID=A0A5C4N354_9RHOB|nr:N-acetylmuramic acid 6-phosphate etherase [Rubellimicrobium rubrum]TNC51233.1 N-acetylmuramic acid 6-phosphate etherase [Rubellimicrobium rubrum]